MKGKFVPFQIFTCGLAIQPSPPMFSFTSWSCLATLAAYSHFPGQFSGEGKIMQAMQTHLGVGRKFRNSGPRCISRICNCFIRSVSN